MLLFSGKRRRERQAADRIYAACAAASRRPELYLGYGVPDTLDGRFEMIALSLFPVLHRLMHDPGDDPDLARLISESFVDDMDATFREMGVSDTAVPKRMATMYSSFAGRTAAYRQAAGASENALAAAIARNVFPEGADDERARALADYLRRAIEVARSAELADLRRGDVPFPPLTSVDGRAKE